MTEAILVAIISGCLTLIGTVITVLSSQRKAAQEMEHTLQTAQAVTDTKIDELTREVREHNGFARRVPVLEQQVKDLGERMANVERKGA